MYREPVGGSSIIAEQDESPACIRWNRGDRPDPNRLGAKLVLPPVQTFVSAKQDVIGGIFVVCHDENRTRISELEEMGVLVNFLPGEPCVAAQESIAVFVSGELLPDVPDGHYHTRNGWCTKRGPGIETFRVSVKVKSAFLKTSFRRKRVDHQYPFIPLYRMDNCDLENQLWEVRSLSRSHLPERNVNMSLNTTTILPTIVVTDTRLQLLLLAQSGVAWVRHNVDDHNSVQPNHLLKINVSAVIPINVVHRQTEVGSVGIGFEYIPPVGIRGLGKRDVQEDRVSTRFQDRVSLYEVSDFGLQTPIRVNRRVEQVASLVGINQSRSSSHPKKPGYQALVSVVGTK